MDKEQKAEWGRELRGELLRRWPKDERGEPVHPVLLTRCPSVDMRDVLLINLLEAYGIPCLKNYPRYGEFGKLMLGMSGFGVDIYVPETMLEDARALCESAPVSGEDEEGEQTDEL